jgi:hypothetical protein
MDEKDSSSPSRWDPSSGWKQHVHFVQCPQCRAAIVASSNYVFYLLRPLERVLPGRSSRDVHGVANGGMSSLAVVGSQELAWPMVCPVSQLKNRMTSNLPCVCAQCVTKYCKCKI